MLKRILQMLVVLCLTLPALHAQVTTGSISGTVKNNNSALEGAVITATHQPSGSTYKTVSKSGGVFNLPGLRVGGPYQVTVSYVGLQTKTYSDITLSLGVPYDLNVVMNENANLVESVTVSTTQRKKIATDRTGAVTVIDSRQIATLPTISRSITDFTKLTPQSNGTNFAGRDGRLNNLTVDGANLNNNFGLSSDPLPGGGNQPISLDAYDAIAVSISPTDVRQGSFTGAGISAVTKSGTNTFHGTAAYYVRDQKMNGRNVGNTKLPEPALSKNKLYTFSIGGPIIKNKLFFFANYENEEKTVPGVQFSPKNGSGFGTVSATTVDSLQKVSDYLKSTYGYDPGAYDNFPNFQTKNRKYLIKLDWNISNQHKLTVKYSDYENTNDVQVNATSVPNGGGFTVTGLSGSQTRLPFSRYSTNSIAFANSNYGFKDVVRSGSVELNSNFNGKFANQLIGTVTKVQDTRTTPSTLFPMVDVFNGNGVNQLSFGIDPFTLNNDVINDVYSAIDNFTWFAGKHTVTAGVSYEYQRVGNMFMPASQSYYIFNSINDFVTNKAPVYYAYTYSIVPGQKTVYSANLKVGQLAFYAQDEYNVSDKFKLNYGIRVDKPTYPEQPIENPAITALSLPDASGNMTHYSTGAWPKSRWYVSPRIGFRYDIMGDKSLIIRGSTGIYTGRIPFVWLTNMPTNSGMYQISANVTSTATLQSYKFNKDPDAYASTFPTTAGTTVPSGGIVLIEPNFKFPQLWRTDLAIDKQIGKGWTFSLEAIVGKDINAVYMRNANQKPEDATVTNANGADVRPRFSSTANATRRYSAGLSNAIVLGNTKKGYQATFTASITKAFSNGFYGSLAYNYTATGEVTANPGSTASSVWNSTPTRLNQNAQEMSYSSYAVPHRIVGSVSYRREYLKHAATTISLFYEGAAQNNFSYIYNGDLNNDGNSQDLMYIPSNLNNINFVDRAAGSGVSAVTAAQQREAFATFVSNSKYLSKIKDGYTERNSAFLPWFNRVDGRLLQEFFVKSGKMKHTVQLDVTVLNLPNLLNKKWGSRSQTVLTNPLQIASVTNGVPSFYMTQVGGQLPTQPFQTTYSTASTWGMQIGVRYLF